MITCLCGQTYDVDPTKSEEEFYSECDICTEIVCDDCCWPHQDGEPRVHAGCD